MCNKIITALLILSTIIIGYLSSMCFSDVPAGIEQMISAVDYHQTSIITTIQQNKFDEAKVLMQELVADFSGHPDLPEALYEIAASECEWRPELAEKAKSIYQQIIQNYPNSPYADKAELGILRADVLSPIMSHDYDRAEEALVQLTANFSEHPDFPETLYWVARAYDRQLKMEYATSTYQQITQSYPYSSWASEAKLGIARAEVMDLILLNENIPSKEAIAKLIAGFSNHPNFPETLYWIAERYRWAREYKEAKNLYKQIIQQHPNSPWADKAKIGFSRVDALSLINAGNYNQLVETVDKLIVDFKDHPDLPETLYWIAQECEWMMKLKKAGSIYQKVIDCCPESHWTEQAELGRTRVNIGDLVEQGDANDAEPALDKMLTDFNDNSDMAETLYWLAQRYQDVNSVEKTKVLYQEILQKWPNSKYPELMMQVYIAAADIFPLVKSGERANAMKAIDKLIVDFSNNPYLPQVVLMMGEDCYRRGLSSENEGLAEQAGEHFEKAVEIWDKLLNKFPDSDLIPETCCWSGDGYLKLGRYEESIRWFQKVPDDYPGYEHAGHAQFLVGRCYELLKQAGGLEESVADAHIKAAYQRVIQEYPDYPAADYARQWLSREK